MRKIVFTLVLLMFVDPTMANVVVTLDQVGDTNEIIINYDATSESPDLVRAFGLNVQLDTDANIVAVIPKIVGLSVKDANGFGIFPGTIVIDAGGNVTNDGTPVGQLSDSPDTLSGLDSNGVTLEMASLYAPVGPGSPNAPAQKGELARFIIGATGDHCITITANVSRAGATGVVMEDPTLVVTVDLPTSVCVYIPEDVPCWSNPCQPFGDYNGDGLITAIDIQGLIAAWGGYDVCADFNQDGFITALDIQILIAQWGQACP